MFDFDYQLKTLPDAPGVYLMRNNLGEIIYVGKAKILRNRVRQYFKSSNNHSVKVMAMVKNIAEFEYIVTDSEMEALILECNLIKKYTPRYNILLKDDKHYPFIKITINEEFPRIFVTRNISSDGGKYFGPYTDSAAVYSTIELIKQIFPLRTCRRNIKEGVLHDRPCLNYHIGLCKAPCTGYINKEDYGKIIKGALELLTGKDKSIKDDLKKKMGRASDALEFEKAVVFRDKIMSIEKINEKQKIIIGNCENEDFINVYVDEKDVCIQVFFLRDGKIVGREHFILNDEAQDVENELIEEFIKRFYGGTAFIPKTIYVPFMSEGEILEQWLSAKKDSKVTIRIPQKGEKKKTLDMVANNAKITLENFKLKDMQDKEVHKIAMQEITELLKLDEIPERIESFDISNIMGVDSVGSMVVFEGGKPKTSDYRRFKIRSVIGANDYDSMREILERRFLRGLDEVKRIKERNLELSKGKFCVFPDLILMDGGKGQVNVAIEVLNNLNINIPVCGMVKDDRHKTRGLIYNNIELFMKSNSQSMHLITRIQDEVHRFAITYHRTLRDKRTLYSILDNIPNVGEKRRRELLKKFGSIDNVKSASVDELMATPSMDSKSSKCVLEYFKNNK